MKGLLLWPTYIAKRGGLESPQPSLDYFENEGLSFKIRKKLCLYLPPDLLPNTIHGGLGQNK
jgi:hypothetical protein